MRKAVEQVLWKWRSLGSPQWCHQTGNRTEVNSQDVLHDPPSLDSCYVRKKYCYLIIPKALEREMFKVYKWSTAMAPSLGPTVVCKKTSGLLVHIFPQLIRLKINILSESFSILMFKRNSHLWKEGKFRASKSTHAVKPDSPSSIPDPMIGGENQLPKIVLWPPHIYSGTHTVCPTHHIHTQTNDKMYV